MLMRDMVLVLNYDNFASRAVTRKLRSERIFCKVVPGDISLQDIQAQEPLGLLLAGGVSGHTPSGMDAGIPAAGIPTLALGDAAGLLMERKRRTIAALCAGDAAAKRGQAAVHRPGNRNRLCP